MVLGFRENRFMSKKIVRNVVDDIPTEKDLFRGKGHDRTALSLAQAIKNFDEDDRSIGLDGPWGSGKSSVVAIAARHLALENRKQKVSYYFFTFDIWKSQGSGFRRSFLEHFVTWAQEKFPAKSPQLKIIRQDIRGKRREVTTNNQPILGVFGIAVLFLLPLLPFYYFWAKTVFDELNKNAESTKWDYLLSSPAILFIVFTIGAVCSACARMRSHEKSRGDNEAKLGFKAALSSVMLISSKQHQDHTAIQKIREIDPNDYEFHTTFRKILRIVQSDTNKVVVVLDNIDRLPQKEIRDYWAIVRSIFSGSDQQGKISRNETITAIVPYDRSHIEDSVNEDNQDGKDHQTKTGSGKELTRLAARELFSKTFDEVLTISPPVLSNAREFFTDKLEEALPNQVMKDHGFRTYRIFTELLRAEGGLTTPRQVVSFVNDVSGLYALHEGKFPLPTVAAYLAHQDLVSQNPGTLNDETKLNSKVVDLASDPNLAKNLAAIVFNVAPELAFEVLLDNELVSAMAAPDHHDLERLSRSSGFDLRVDDVLQTNSEEWRSTGDFGSVMTNFAKILPNYPGAAKPRIVDALVQSFSKIDSISIARNEYQSLLLLFDVVEGESRPILIREFLRKVFEGASKLEDADFDAGQAFAKFLGLSRLKFEELNLLDQFKTELGKLSPNSAADFLYGLALGIVGNSMKFSNLGRVEIEFPKEGNYYKGIALRDPDSALVALEQFSLKSILEHGDWVEIANSCIQKCVEDGHSQEIVASLLDLVCFARSQIPKENRNEVSLSTAMIEGQFFRNLGVGESEESAKAIALAVFLAGEATLGQQVAPPTTTTPTGPRVQDVSEEFNQFNAIITGESDLSDSQAELIANKAKAAGSIVENWTKFGCAHDDHPAVKKVIKAAYLNDALPNINVHGLNLYFDYLTDLLGDKAFIEMLNRFEPQVSETEISNVQLKSISIGFLPAIHQAQGEGWKKYLEKIDVLLKEITSNQWQGHLATFDLNAQLLAEKVTTTGCSLESSKFREPIVETMLGIFSGESTPPAPDGAFDKMILAIDSSFYGGIWRKLREKLTDVGPETLGNAARLFPNVLSSAISEGDRVLATEKDQVIRHILCPALEGDNRFVLKVFIQMGNKRISDFRKSSHDSTKTMLNGTLDSFSKSSKDRAWTKQVIETIEGKRRARSLLDVLWGVNKDED